jgi:hypothetical protein
VGSDHGRPFGHIHGGAAAKSDDQVKPSRLHDPGAFFDNVDVRLRLRVDEDFGSPGIIPHGLQDPLQDPQPLNIRTGDDEDLFGVHPAKDLPQELQGPLPYA